MCVRRGTDSELQWEISQEPRDYHPVNSDRRCTCTLEHGKSLPPEIDQSRNSAPKVSKNVSIGMFGIDPHRFRWQVLGDNPLYRQEAGHTQQW
jgi:hypothetical protein